VDKTIRFWNFIARRYSKNKVADQAAYEAKLEKTRALFQKDMNVLEFGCGTGSTALLHAPHVARYLATDYSSKMIGIAAEKLASSELQNLEFKCATIDDPTLPEASYDMALGLNIMHLIPEYERAMKRVADLLKPGGYLVTSTVCLGSGGPLKWIVNPLAWLGFLPRVCFFTSDTYTSALERNGFAIVEHTVPGKDKRVYFTIAKKK
jgi:ubiquinone/menaquinone biosynthesis C-methylase UbiE